MSDPSLKLDYGGDNEYLYSRVANCFLPHTPTNQLVEVYTVEKETASAKFGPNTSVVPVPLTELSLKPPAFGYFQCTEMFRSPTAVRPMRLPRRRDWRQGLRKSQFQFRQAPNGSKVRIPSLFLLNQPLSNQYPKTFEYVVGNLDDGYLSVALSRNFALSDKFKLYCGYRPQTEIGIVDDRGVPILSKRFQELRELLVSEVPYFNQVMVK